jgi:hypothetical protein
VRSHGGEMSVGGAVSRRTRRFDRKTRRGGREHRDRYGQPSRNSSSNYPRCCFYEKRPQSQFFRSCQPSLPTDTSMGGVSVAPEARAPSLVPPLARTSTASFQCGAARFAWIKRRRVRPRPVREGSRRRTDLEYARDVGPGRIRRVI